MIAEMEEKAYPPKPLGLMLNHMQWVPEACLKVYDGDGYMAL